LLICALLRFCAGVADGKSVCTASGVREVDRWYMGSSSMVFVTGLVCVSVTCWLEISSLALSTPAFGGS